MSELSSDHPDVIEWLAHIKALAVGIGPRGPTRQGERSGAEYAKASMTRAGLKPVREAFRSARSIFHPHLLGSLIMLIAFSVFPLGGMVTAGIAALLTIVVIVSELQELGFRDNLFRALVPKAESQNVFAVIPPKGRHERDLVLVGHVDTQRTPLVFRTPGWVKVMVFEMVGCAGPSWLVREGIIVPFHSDPRLRRTAERLAAEHPEWKAYASSISGGNSELSDAVRFKVPAIALGGMTRDGVLPYWHQRQDTFDKMDPEVMARAWEMTLALIREIDHGEDATGPKKS